MAMREEETTEEATTTLEVALTTRTADLGKALIAEALKEYDKKRQAAVIKEVERIMAARDEYKNKLHFAEKAIAFYNRKISALDAGEFDVVPQEAGMAGNFLGGIRFNEEELNKPNF